MEETSTGTLDPWVVSELEQLRSDNMDAEELIADTEADNNHLRAVSAATKRKYEDLRDDFNSKLTSANRELTTKLIIYSDLFDEYESIIQMYVSQTGVQLITNKIKQLRQRGEIDA